ncbi:MAG: cyclodeaminase/cyclohydrolase family protein [Chloroflexota bacterium]|nr:cyclodeaminase/cyclohydrolase family protein [Chloroflexota bacterium]
MADIDAFLDDLSSAAPVPGGGTVAALETAMAASLLAMVCNLTLGKKRYAAVEPRIRTALQEAGELRDRARQLGDEDVEAYGAVARVLALPRVTEEEKATRAARLQDALRGAAVPPLETMQLASQVLYLAGDLVDIGNSSAISDIGTAAASARAGFEAARLNVEINLAGIQDQEWALATRRAMDQIPAPELLEQTIMQKVTSIIRGNIA